MTLSLQEISDRLEIEDLIYRYAEAIDVVRKMKQPPHWQKRWIWAIPRE